MPASRVTTFLLVLVTLTAFASNSILCRSALLVQNVGPLTFTIIRLLSGMLILLPVLMWGGHSRLIPSDRVTPPSKALKVNRQNILMPLFMFSYALFFSLAYVQLNTGTGAIILFPTVQITMIGMSLFWGNRLTVIEWVGVGLALGGLVYLLLPGLTAPPLSGAIMMILSGISWGGYSLVGKSQTEPIRSTARNFLFTVPLVLVLLAVLFFSASPEAGRTISSEGFSLAILSGAIASGVGYVLWYLSLREISWTMASLSQLAVPVIAALGGILFLHEKPTLRLGIASVLILGGILVAVAGRRQAVSK